jgi:DNA-binding LytR/AlgR family response regulator
MLLMRLADAIAEMDVTPGLQVHRSWWVAEGAVRKVERKGRTIMLTLSNGIAVPVSRPNVAKVKQAGWIL